MIRARVAVPSVGGKLESRLRSFAVRRPNDRFIHALGSAFVEYSYAVGQNERRGIVRIYIIFVVDVSGRTGVALIEELHSGSRPVREHYGKIERGIAVGQGHPHIKSVVGRAVFLAHRVSETVVSKRGDFGKVIVFVAQFVLDVGVCSEFIGYGREVHFDILRQHESAVVRVGRVLIEREIIVVYIVIGMGNISVLQFRHFDIKLYRLRFAVVAAYRARSEKQSVHACRSDVFTQFLGGEVAELVRERFRRLPAVREREGDVILRIHELRRGLGHYDRAEIGGNIFYGHHVVSVFDNQRTVRDLIQTFVGGGISGKTHVFLVEIQSERNGLSAR